MFQDYRELICRLKSSNRHFEHLFEEHNTLDHMISNMESGIQRASAIEIENLKKLKLRLKDEIYAMLKAAEA